MMVSREIDTEICVIGGGPAGATAARRLALLGHQVCLLERAAFPRRHIGESLTPGIIPLLEFLDLLETVERADFLRPAGALVSWAGQPQFTEATGRPGFQVDRGRFDQILLAFAASVGVRLLQPAFAQTPRREGGRWRIPVRIAGERSWVSARFLVDASGRRSLLTGVRRRDDIATIALYAYWEDTGIVDPATRIEAGSDEWFWGAPLPDGTFNAAVFVDPQRCADTGRRGLADLYRAILKRSTLLAPCLSGRRVSKVIACDASRRFVVAPVGDDFIKVGEASFTIDPLSSQGVQAAITSALQASVVVHTMLTRPDGGDAAMAFYLDRQAESVDSDRASSSAFYREKADTCPRSFWQKRSCETTPVDARPTLRNEALNSAARIRWATDVQHVDVPVIRDDLIVSVRGLRHPSLGRPIAFIENFPVDRLSHLFMTETTVEQLIQIWSTKMPRAQAVRTLSWLWARRLVIHTIESAGHGRRARSTIASNTFGAYGQRGETRSKRARRL